ncbi:MAG: hypothetical protein PWP23_3195 [Candidatus Sumerlaeota bacterium]|nr:hypothetical protein [Candidatus Sumerlaeota bacterium]
MMASVMQYSGPLPNPIAKQVTPEHIDKLLENNQQEMVLEHSKEMRKLTLSFFTVILLVGFLVFCIVFLKDDSELRKLLITGILSLVTGLAGGYGLGRSSAKP